MKNKRNLLIGLFMALTALISLPVLAQQSTKPATYQLDIIKSKLFWQAPKNHHESFILFNSGALTDTVAGWPTRGTFSINMNSMKSTDKTTAAERKKVDDKLRSEGFFAVSKYPTATMVVNKIQPVGDGVTFGVAGSLTIKGITKPIQFNAVMKQNANTLTATASTNISRANWNVSHEPTTVSWNILDRLKDNLIAPDLPIRLELVFTRK